MKNKALFSWKEIANYLGISVFTLRKNYKRWKIPIKLLPTEKGVYAKPFITLEDLQNWMKNHIENSPLKD